MFALILSRVDPNATSGFGFEGEYVRPGAMIEEERLFLPGANLRTALLLECAGDDGTGRGHRRSPCLYLLWKYQRATREWTELARSASVDWMWAQTLRGIAIKALREEFPAVTIDVAALAGRIAWLLDGELAELGGADLAVALDLLHREFSVRMVKCAVRSVA